MKEVLIYSVAGFLVIQTLVLLAVLAAAARPIPKFQREALRAPKVQSEELELVS